MRYVYIISPVSEGECTNPERIARFYTHLSVFSSAVREVIDAGCIPVAPQLFTFGKCLDSTVPRDREAGLRISEHLLRMVACAGEVFKGCDGVCSACPLAGRESCNPPAVWIYGHATEPTDACTVPLEGRYMTEQMVREIKLARELGLTFTYMEDDK
jgi:hypothetical protein